MTTPYDPYATATQQLPNATQSQIPGNIIGQYSTTINTSELNFTSEANGGMFGYSGSPGAGNLYFALAPVGGTDAFGNTYATGINVLSGQMQGVNLVSAQMDSTSTLIGSNIQAPTILTPSVSGGTAANLVHTMQNANGNVLGYVSSSTSVTYSTNTITTFTVPTGVTSLRVQCWGAGAGGNGGNATQGGPGGGGGEYAEEPSYQVSAGQIYNVIVGTGGVAGSTNVTGGNGGITNFYGVDFQGNPIEVTANGGEATSGYFLGGGGGAGSTNTIHFDGGPGANGSGNTGAGGGGSSAGTGGAGNTGAQSSGATGGAGGTPPTGGAAGGAGGNDLASGSAGSGPGGGGGGEGAGAGSLSSKTYILDGSWSYYGPDASSPNALANHDGPMYQGILYGDVNGHMYTYILIPYAKMIADLTGATIQSIYFRIHNLHCYYSTGMYCNLKYSSDSTFGSKGDGGSGAINVNSFNIKEGAIVNQQVSNALATAIVGGNAKSLLLGPGNGSGQGLNYAGYFDSGSNGTSPALGVNYWPGATGATAGAGADGQIILTYNAGTVPTFQLSVSATSGADPFGNPYNAGFAGPNFVTPGSSSTVATFNAGGLTVQTASNSGTVGSSATPTGLTGQNLLLFVQGETQATNSTGSVVFSNGNTDLKYMNFNDGNAYYTGRLTQVFTSGTLTISSTVNTTILSATVSANYYAVKAFICGNYGSNSNTIGVLGFATSTGTLTAGIIAFYWSQQGGQSSPENAFNTTTFSNMVSAGPSTSSTQVGCLIEGMLGFTSAGTVTVSGRVNTTGFQYQIGHGSYLEIRPVT